MKNDIRIVFTSDQNYIYPTLISIYSILRNSNLSRKIIFYFITDKPNIFFKKKIENLKETFKNFELNYILFDKSKYQIPTISKRHITSATYFRFLLGDIIDDSIDKILFLDSDILVYKQLDRIYDINLNKNTIAAVEEKIDINDIRLKEICHSSPSYFNAGVMLINLKRWRDEKIKDKLFSSISVYQKQIKWPSQDPLNIVFNGRWKIIDNTFNTMNERIDSINSSKITIFHYVGSIKPWSSFKKNYFHTTYRDYMMKFAPFRSMIFLLKNKLKRMMNNE